MAKKNEWTWDEIAALRGEERKAFLKTYGDRAKAALLAAGHAPGTQFPGGCRAEWRCHHCPLLTRASGICTKDAHAVYERMVRKLGVEPEEK